MEKQTLLRLGMPPGAAIYASKFKEKLAAHVDALGAANATKLFHHGENGPIAAMPGLRFVGAKNWVGILADSDNQPLLFEFMGAAVKVATELAGRPVPVNVEEHKLDLKPLQYPKTYWIREMALKRRHPKARNADINDLVLERLTKSIERQCARYGIECPTAEQLEISVDVTRDLGMPLTTTTGVTKEYVTLANASFTIHAELTGFWFAGNLTSRGYGRIGVDLAQLSSKSHGGNANEITRRVAG